MESTSMKIVALLLLLFASLAAPTVTGEECCEEIKREGDDKECVFDTSCHEKGNCCPDTDSVETVRQNYKCDVNCLLVKQIHWELRASYLYQAYASYFQRADVSLPGIREFFAHASLEERGHADYFIEYINKRGGHVQLDQFEVQNTCKTVWDASQTDGSGLYTGLEKRMCICGFVTPGGKDKVNAECLADRDDWMEGLMAFEDALVVERFVNQKLLDLHKRADDLDDAHLTHILEHDFLEEQVQAIYELGLYVTRLRKFAPKTTRNAKSSTSHYKLGEYIFDQDLQKSLKDKKSETGADGKRNYGGMA